MNMNISHQLTNQTSIYFIQIELTPSNKNKYFSVPTPLLKIGFRKDGLQFLELKIQKKITKIFEHFSKYKCH